MPDLIGFFEGRPRARPHPVAEAIGVVDAHVERAIDGLRSPVADRAFYTLTNAAEHGRLWLAIGAARALVVPRHRSTYARFAMALGVESLITNGVVKTAFRRVRPAAYYDDGPLPFKMRRPITSAFPSGHAASAFAAATLLADDDPLAPAYFGLAALVAASRVYVRMHHTSDVVAGALWGAAVGRVARRFLAPKGSAGVSRRTGARSARSDDRRRRGRAPRS